MKVPDAANKRFIVSNDSIWWRDLIGAVGERFRPEGWPVPQTEKPRPDDFDDSTILRMDNSASKSILQTQYRPYQETMVDMAAMMIDRGMVSKPAQQ